MSLDLNFSYNQNGFQGSNGQRPTNVSNTQSSGLYHSRHHKKGGTRGCAEDLDADGIQFVASGKDPKISADVDPGFGNVVPGSSLILSLGSGNISSGSNPRSDITGGKAQSIIRTNAGNFAINSEVGDNTSVTIQNPGTNPKNPVFRSESSESLGGISGNGFSLAQIGNFVVPFEEGILRPLYTVCLILDKNGERTVVPIYATDVFRIEGIDVVFSGGDTPQPGDDDYNEMQGSNQEARNPCNARKDVFPVSSLTINSPTLPMGSPCVETTTPKQFPTPQVSPALIDDFEGSEFGDLPEIPPIEIDDELELNLQFPNWVFNIDLDFDINIPIPDGFSILDFTYDYFSAVSVNYKFGSETKEPYFKNLLRTFLSQSKFKNYFNFNPTDAWLYEKNFVTTDSYPNILSLASQTNSNALLRVLQYLGGFMRTNPKNETMEVIPYSDYQKEIQCNNRINKIFILDELIEFKHRPMIEFNSYKKINFTSEISVESNTSESNEEIDLGYDAFLKEEGILNDLDFLRKQALREYAIVKDEIEFSVKMSRENFDLLVGDLIAFDIKPIPLNDGKDQFNKASYNNGRYSLDKFISNKSSTEKYTIIGRKLNLSKQLIKFHVLRSFS